MSEIPDCSLCQFYSYHYVLVCALHPEGPKSDTCPDFIPDPELLCKRFEDFLGLQWHTGHDSLEYVPLENPFNLDPDENWSPERTRFINGELVIEPSVYNGELIQQPKQRWTPEEKLELLDWHPLFTGRCPACEMPYPQYETPPIHWDCEHCNWKDDTV